MKPILLIIIMLATFTSCKDKSKDPTIFEGKVVYEDDGSPFIDGEVHITGMKYYVYARVYIYNDTLLSDTGNFKIAFNYDEEIDYFDLAIFLNDGGIISTTVGGLNCSPYDCDDFEPGKTYNDLIIKVPR